MKLIPFYGVSWESNSYLLIDGDDALLIDAGVNCQTVLDTLSAEGATLRNILLTHGHFDHTVSIDALRQVTDAKLLIHEADAEMLTDAEKSALTLFFGTNRHHIPADETLSEGDLVPLGNTTIRILHTPGHSKGSVCYLVNDMLFCGDTLFAEGYGRYDLYGGDANTLANSLGKLRILDPMLTIYPGHGAPAGLATAIDRLFG